MNSQNNINVLIVEDNTGDFLLVQEYLSEAFPNAVIKHDEMLADALITLKEKKFDVVLLDLSLPDSDGYNSITGIKNIDTDLAIIVLTGSGDKQTGINSLRLGVQDYLLKDNISSFILQKSITSSIEQKIRSNYLQ